jgi:hypothetical protein
MKTVSSKILLRSFIRDISFIDPSFRFQFSLILKVADKGEERLPCLPLCLAFVQTITCSLFAEVTNAASLIK